MTKAELMELLANYPDDARLVMPHHSKGRYTDIKYVVEVDLHPIRLDDEVLYGDWLDAEYGLADKQSQKFVLIDTL